MPTTTMLLGEMVKALKEMVQVMKDIREELIKIDESIRDTAKQ